MEHEITDRHVILAMKRYGGSFAIRLGDAALYADSENLRIIKKAFPVLWQHYTEAAKQEARLHRANFGKET